MKRITVEMVKEAYAKTGLKPYQGFFYTTQYENEKYVHCSCAIGAIYTSETGVEGDFEAEGYAIDNFGQWYKEGFVDGFDGMIITEEPDESETDEMRVRILGNQDGRAAWEAVCSND